jgi:hypothetical protein
MDWQGIDTGYFEAFAKAPYSRRPNLGLRLPAKSCVLAVRPWSGGASSIRWRGLGRDPSAGRGRS